MDLPVLTRGLNPVEVSKDRPQVNNSNSNNHNNNNNSNINNLVLVIVDRLRPILAAVTSPSDPFTKTLVSLIDLTTLVNPPVFHTIMMILVVVDPTMMILEKLVDLTTMMSRLVVLDLTTMSLLLDLTMVSHVSFVDPTMMSYVNLVDLIMMSYVSLIDHTTAMRATTLERPAENHLLGLDHGPLFVPSLHP
ncbi:hypothetical protein PG993_010648 [Apiospora rasikravindrae]|uniref:Uncharacterized protein n=1 Tax=Apiospora rasikravindrae TaxID=990691 RepID=A0ABR1SMU4_9PEZI